MAGDREAGSANTSALVPDLIPVRMLNEQAYCPRLAYFEWVQGDFEDNADTVDGRFQHRNVDHEAGELPDPDEPIPERLHARSVLLSAPLAGLIAKMDLVESDGEVVTPVDYKRGRAPSTPERSWEPERVQLCAQAMILEENGYRATRGILYFVASKQRVEILFDDVLRARTQEQILEMRGMCARAEPPPPLVDSPKCPRCSLVNICLPDETNLLRGVEESRVRRLIPARDDAAPVYVHTAGTKVGKSGDVLTISPPDDEPTTARLKDTSQLTLFGAVQISTQAVHELCRAEIPIVYLTAGGHFSGITHGLGHKNVELRRRQFACAEDPTRSLAIARRLVSVKIRNCRTLVRRNGEDTATALRRLKESITSVEQTTSLESLLGVEGTAARVYFQAFGTLLKHATTGDNTSSLNFDFDGRNRRPPRDPVNALLSLGYALLAKDLTVALQAAGFDPYLGFYHQPRYGRPALALDVMEEFRPLIVDSVVLNMVNTNAIKLDDFVRRGGAVALTRTGRRKFFESFERRMDEEVTHPVFGYRISYRRTLDVQVRLLARYVTGEITDYPPFATR